MVSLILNPDHKELFDAYFGEGLLKDGASRKDYNFFNSKIENKGDEWLKYD